MKNLENLKNLFTTNKLIDRTKNFKSNASRFKQKKYAKNAPQARFFGNDSYSCSIWWESFLTPILSDHDDKICTKQ